MEPADAQRAWRSGRGNTKERNPMNAHAQLRPLILAFLTLAVTGLGALVLQPTGDARADETLSSNKKTTLKVVKAGDGTGTVTSDPAGIDCGPDCEEVYEEKVKVTLTALADPGSVFVGWDPGGGPGCPGAGTCSLNMATDKKVVATFRKLKPFELTVTRSGDGTGTVTSDPAGIDCGADCSEEFPKGTEVTLEAAPAPGSTFEGWSGPDCSGIGSCSVTMNQAKAVNAEFAVIPPERFPLKVEKTGTGSGFVGSTPEGIECGDECSAEFDEGTEVTLSAEPDEGSSFEGWSGAGCSGTDPCQVSMSEARQVEASFRLDPGPPTFLLSVVKTGSAEGTVTASPGDIDCGPVCSQEFAKGTVVTLTATAANGDVFTGWTGPCEDDNPCVVTMNESKTVTASFNGQPPPNFLVSVARNGTGDGRVVSDPAAIDCGEVCAALLPGGSQLSLNAKPDFASTFEGWVGAGCDGVKEARCDLEVDGPQFTDALFKAKPGGGATVRKFRKGLNRVPGSRILRAVTVTCQIGPCEIKRLRTRVIARGRKLGAVSSTVSRAKMSSGQSRVIRVTLPESAWRRLGTKRSGQLRVNVGVTAEGGRRAVRRGIRIGLRR